MKQLLQLALKLFVCLFLFRKSPMLLKLLLFGIMCTAKVNRWPSPVSWWVAMCSFEWNNASKKQYCCYLLLFLHSSTQSLDLSPHFLPEVGKVCTMRAGHIYIFSFATSSSHTLFNFHVSKNKWRPFLWLCVSGPADALRWKQSSVHFLPFL